MKNFTKKFLLFTTLLFVTSFLNRAHSQCADNVDLHTFTGFDSWGDGWNGGSVDIIVTPVGGAPTVAVSGFSVTGSSGSTSFLAQNGDQITLSWVPGGYPGEISFNITDAVGTTIASGNTSSTGAFTASGCPIPAGTCAPPGSLSTTSTTTDSATVTWADNTAGDGSDSFDLEYTDPDGIATTVSGVSSPYTINNLSPATTYTFNVTSNCTSSATSETSSDATFTTECVAISAFPYLESFETITTGQPVCWGLEGTTTTASYHFSSFATGQTGRGMRFDSYYNSTGRTSELMTPVIDASVLTTLELDFQFKNPTGGNFEVLVSSDGGSTYTSLETGLTGQTDWVSKNYNLTSYISSNMLVKFKGTSNYGSGDARIYLDEIRIREMPSCTVPTALSASATSATEATVSWTAGDSETAWKYVVQASGTGEPTGDGTATTTNPLTLSGLTADTAYEIYLRADCGGELSEWVSTTFSTPVSCLPPTSLSATATSSTEATVSWTAGDSETTWEYVVQGAGTGEPTAVGTFTTTNPLSLSGLTANTAYEIYLRADCGGSPPPPGEFSGSGDTSTWISTTFNTPCDAFTAPYSQDFSGLTVSTSPFTNEGCWSATNTAVFWEVVATTDTSSGTTGPASGVSDGNYMLFEASATGTNAVLISPPVDLSSLTSAELNFDYHMYGSTMGDLVISIVDSSGNETTLDTISGQQQTSESAPFVTHIIDLSSYSGVVTINFTASRGTSYYGDISIDNFQIAEAPSCSPPTILSATATSPTEVTVSWTAGGTETAWEYVVQASGTGEPTGDGTATTTNPLPLSGLTANTAYEFYLRADCGDDASPWVITTFNTPCSTISAFPYLESFETITTGQPDCWSLEGTTTTASYHFSSNATGQSGRGMRFDSYLNSTGRTSELITPVIDASSLTTLELNFQYANPAGGNFEVLVSNDNGSTYTSLETGLTGQSSFVPKNYDLTSYISSTMLVKFKATSNYGPQGAYVYLDEVGIREIPSCTAPSGLSISAVTSTEATVSWTAGGTETAWEYVVQASGTGEPTGDGTATTTNPLPLSGLTANTAYEIYLRADCGDNTSPWVSTTFRTSCGSYSGAWSNNFDIVGGVAPDHYYCWSVINGGDANGWQLNNNGEWQLVYSAAAHSDYLISPIFSVTSGVSDRFTFEARNESLQWAESVDVYVFNTDLTAIIGTLATAVTPAETNESFSYDLSAYDGQDIRVVIFSSTTAAYIIYIDNVVVDELPDTEAPVITLVGDNPLELNIGDVYADPGATATDNLDGDLTATITVGGDTVSTTASGTFTVTYDVSDAAGNQATQVTRVVNVSCPAPTNLSATNITFNTATLNWDSTGSAFMIELQPTGVPRQGTAGDYGYIIGDWQPVTTTYFDIPYFPPTYAGLPPNTSIDFWIYNLCDYTGDGSGPITINDSAVSASGTFVTLPDTEAPVITLIGDNPLELNNGDAYTDPGVSITDNHDYGQTLQSALVVGGDVVNTSVDGTYTVTYDVSDSSQNAAIQVTRVVNVTTPFTAVAGDIIITEILKNPTGTDGNGEYFEIYNNTTVDIDINGWTIKDADTDSHVIDNGGPLQILAGGYLTLGVNSDTAVNGGINHDYIYSGITLANGSDEVIIEDPNGTVVDQVFYDSGYPNPNGPTMQLDLNSLSATDNDTGSNWCDSEQNYGTPGAANTACDPPTCAASFGSHVAICDDSAVGNSETVIADWNFIDNDISIDYENSNFIGTNVTSKNLNWLVGDTANVDQTGTDHDNEITINSRSGYSGDFLNNLALDPSSLIDGKIHLSVGIKNINFTNVEDTFWMYLKTDTGGNSGTATHKLAGIDVTAKTGNNGNFLRIGKRIYNNGNNNGVAKQVGHLGNTGWVRNTPINLGITIDYPNQTFNFWVGSPGENTSNPYGMVWANDANQSTTVAMLANQLISDMQIRIVSQNPSSIEIDQVKISTGTYENTVALGDAEEFYSATPGDTYSVTLPYSGAGGSTFVVGSTAGTVGGDDPSTTASGDITVTGIPVGTDVTITMDDTGSGGICDLSTTITSPDCTPQTPDLEFKGILDIPVSGGADGTAVHFVATDDIPALSIYGIGIANNGAGTDGLEIPLSYGTLIKGTRSNISSGDNILLLRSATFMQNYFDEGCYDNFDVVIEVGGGLSFNGDDAFTLYMNGELGSTSGLVETFGDVDVDGTGEAWEYNDSWAYKDDGIWIYGGVDCAVGATLNSTSGCPYPFCIVLPPYDWTGNVDTAWEESGNWAGGSVPDSTSDVTISDDPTNYPMVSTDAFANSVSVATGATLTVSESGSLTITGDFANAGTVTMNSDSQEFSSLIVGGTSTGDIDYNRFVNEYSEPGDDNIQWDLIGSPVDGLEISTFANDNPSLATSGDYYGIGTYDNSSQLWTNYTSATSIGVDFDMGLGYQMATSVASSTAATSTSFATGNTAWPYNVVGSLADDGNTGEAQTFEINVRSLPAGGANYRVFKTTANNSTFTGDATALTLGVNTITVAAATFARTVKLQVSSGDIAFNSLIVNGVMLHGYSVSETVSASSSFNSGNNAWPFNVVGSLANDGNNGEAQTLEINVTSLPTAGADYRVFKTLASGNDFLGNPQPLELGVNTITVGSVTFARTVKFQFSDGSIAYDNLVLNGQTLYDGSFSGSTLSFEGSVATAPQTQAIIDNSASGDYWNLVSNPYPSYLNLNTTSDETNNFVSVNGVSVYGWNSGSTGAYTVYNQISPTPSTPLYIAPGQGFFVSAESASSVSFTQAMQTTSGGDDYVSGRMDGSFTYFYLNLNEGDDLIANSMFYFDDGMGYGYDAGYDAEAFSQSTKIMSRMLEGNVGLGMQVNAMPTEALDDSTVIPLDVNQTAGTVFTIGLADTFNLAENVEVYLEDTQLQTFTDLKAGDYTISPENDLSGVGRFYLVFGTNSLGGNTMDESYITIYKPFDEDYISIEGLLNVQNAKVNLYNILGQKVLNTSLKTNQSVQRISTTELASGVYVVKLQADNAVISKKLIIN